MDNNTKALLSTLNNEWATANPDEGGGSSPWPPEGEYECLLLGIEVESRKQERDSGQEVDVVHVAMRYKLIDDPDRQDPLEWKGTPVRFPSDLKNLKEGYQKALEIDRNRLANNLKHILG